MSRVFHRRPLTLMYGFIWIFALSGVAIYEWIT